MSSSDTIKRCCPLDRVGRLGCSALPDISCLSINGTHLFGRARSRTWQSSSPAARHALHGYGGSHFVRLVRQFSQALDMRLVRVEADAEEGYMWVW